MARGRMIKPEFWDDEKLQKISLEARLVFVGTWNFSDDYGVVKANPRWLRSRIFPYGEITPQKFEGFVKELESGGFLIPFEANQEIFYLIRNFNKHQTINRPSQIRNPEAPGGLTEGSLSTHGGLTAQVKLKEVKLKEVNSTPAHLFKNSKIKDKADFIDALMSEEKGKDFAGADYGHYYEVLKDWAEGKAVKRADWQATARTIMRRDIQEGKLKKRQFNNRKFYLNCKKCGKVWQFETELAMKNTKNCKDCQNKLEEV